MKKMLAIGLIAVMLLATSITALALTFPENTAPESLMEIGSEMLAEEPTGNSGTAELLTVSEPPSSVVKEEATLPAEEIETGSSIVQEAESTAPEPASDSVLQQEAVPALQGAPLAAITPVLVWSDGSTALSTGVLAQDVWSDTMLFQYPVAGVDLAIGQLVFTVDMGAQWPGTLALGTGSNYLTMNALGGGVWEFTNKVVLPADSTLDIEIEANLNGQVRNLAVGQDGTIAFSAITLTYSDPDTAVPEALPPLSLTVETKQDAVSLAKEIKTVDVVPPPGLLPANYPEMLTHSFVNWEIKASETLYTRGFAAPLVLTDAIPSVGAGMGSVVSVRADSTFLYKEGDSLPSSGDFTLDANGNLSITSPVMGATYSVIVKYPRGSFPSGLLAVENTAEIAGYYKGEAGPARILSTATTPPTDIIPADGSPGKFSPDISKAYSISVARERPQGNGGGSALYGGDIFARNKIEGTQRYGITVGKSLPGNPVDNNGTADVAVYIDVFTYAAAQLDTTKMQLTALHVGALAGTPVTSAEVFFKDSVSGSWSAVAVSPDGAGNVAVPAGTLYAKVVYKGVAGTGNAKITATYQPTQLLIDQVESGVINSEYALGLYAGLAIFDGADGTTSLFTTIPQASYPTKIISKVNIWPPATGPGHGNLVEYLDTYLYNEAEPGVVTMRAVAGTRVCDWLFVANTPTASVTWKADTERFEFTAGYTLDNAAQQGSPIRGFTMAMDLPENIFLDTDKIHEGDYLAPYFGSEFTSGGQFHAGAIETTMVAVNGVQRQRVIIPLELWENGDQNTPGTWQGNGHNTSNSVIRLPFYTEDVDRYKAGVRVDFKNYLVVAGYSGLNSRFNGTGGTWVKDRNNSTDVWDGAKFTNRDNSIEDWMLITPSSVTIPNNVITTFSGVRKYVLDAQNNPVLSSTVQPGKTWKYRIEVVSNQGRLKDVVVYDILPAVGDTFMGTGNARGSQFSAYFLGADLSAIPQEKRPTIYYSTSPAPAKNITSPDWTTVAPPALDIKAVAFDFGSTEFNGVDGTPDKAVIELTMGTNNDAALVNKTVLNSLYATYNIRRGTGNYTPGLARDSAAVRTTVVPKGANYATIAATVFRDGNNDGILNETDAGLAGREVVLYRNGITPTDAVDQTTTDLNGNFVFTVDANPGDYFVGFVSQGNEKFSPFTQATGVYTDVNAATIAGAAGFTNAIVIQDTDIAGNVTFNRANAGLSLWYALQYDGNGGAPAPVDANSPHLAGSTVQAMGAGAMVRTGYQWTGWNTAADGSGTAYAAGAAVTMNSDTTLFAQWKLLPPVSSSVPASSSVPSSSSAPVSSSTPVSSSSAPSSSQGGTTSSAVPPVTPSSSTPAQSSRPASSRPVSSRPVSSSAASSSAASSSSASESQAGGVVSSSSASSKGVVSGSGSGAGSRGSQTGSGQTGNIIADLTQNKVPFGSLNIADAWSLLNLCMALIATFAAILLTLAYLVKKISGKSKEEKEASRYRAPGSTEKRRNPALRWFAVAAGIITMLLFLLLEDLTLPYVFINRWTPLIFVVFAVHMVLLLLYLVGKPKEKTNKKETGGLSSSFSGS